jgi:uncharacterized protein (TIGR02284 family)
MLGQHGLRDEINKLIRFYFDSKEDYRLAAKRATDPQEQALLSKLCTNREHFHLELQDIITKLKVEGSDNGTVMADLKRDWERLRGSIAGHGLEAALKLAQQSETRAMEQAEQLLKVGVPAELSEAIHGQLQEIREARTQIDSMLARIAPHATRA